MVFSWYFHGIFMRFFMGKSPLKINEKFMNIFHGILIGFSWEWRMVVSLQDV
jgi:hypothetical protein